MKFEKHMMQSNTKYLVATLLVIFLLGKHAIGQPQVITYDYKEQKFSNQFPFDTPFRIVAKNLKKDGIKYMEICIKDITKAQKIVRKLQNSKIAVTNKRIFNHRDAPSPYIIKLDEIRGDSAVFDIIARFAPNRTYFTEIRSGELRSLTSTEKASIRPALESDPEVLALIDSLVKRPLINTRPGGSIRIDASFIDNFRTDFINIVSNYLIDNYSNYRLGKIDQRNLTNLLTTDPTILFALGDLNTNYQGLRQLVDEVNSIGGFSRKKKLDFQKLTKDLSIGTLKAGDAEADDILNKIEAKCSGFSDANAALYNKAALQPYIDGMIQAKDDLLAEILDQLMVTSIRYFTALNTTYPAVPSERANNYVFVDTGIGYVNGNIDIGFGYTSVNIYFRPINTAIPLSDYNHSLKSIILSRLSILIGMNLTGQIDEPNRRKGFLGNNRTVMGGFGCRLFPGIKINAGLMGYEKFPSQLVEKSQLGTSFFTSFSIDFGVSGVFKKAFDKTSVLP
ncbi:MAG: hypothetical protein AAF990_18570 [Bacteroidota bacterium]